MNDMIWWKNASKEYINMPDCYISVYKIKLLTMP